MASSRTMSFTDFLGFSSMVLIVIGSVNWGVVGIRYAAGALPAFDDAFEGVDATALTNVTKYQLYDHVPTPDLLELLGASATVQLIVYWAVFAAGLTYMMLFVYNSIEVRTEDA